MQSSDNKNPKEAQAQPSSLDNLLDVARDSDLHNALVNSALDCIIIMDQNGYIIEFNPAAVKTFGYTREEAISRRLGDLIVPEELRDAHENGLKRYLKTGEAVVLGNRIEVPAINKDHERLIVELAISPFEFRGQKYFSGYIRNITDEKAAEAKLRETEERFHSLFELSADAIIVLDASGRILQSNQSACEQLGWDKDELIGQNIQKFYPNDQSGDAVAALAQTTVSGAVRLEMDFLRSDGTRFNTEVVGNRINTPEGPIYHGIARDISLRVAAQKNLEAAKEAAEKASRAKSDFLANMSHEMRTPLNGVIGSLSLVSRDGLSEEAARFVSAAERSAETLLTLIDDLLDLSRIEAGQTDLELSVFDPMDFITIVQEVFTATSVQKGIRLITNCDVTSKKLKADSGKIRQILLNLVGNAMKFTQRGSIDVFMHETHGLLNFRIIDTGIGISDEDQIGLFDRFRQVDSSTTKQHGGAGLGLAICRELVQLMDGKISVKSVPGEGAKFEFSIPVIPIDAAKLKKTEPQAVASKLAGRVLIAEDSQTNAMVAIAMLQKLGLDHVHVLDGAAAVDAALNDQFDAILMDVSMPNMDGISATRLLRDRGYDRPIVGMTAHALKGDRDRAIESGMSGYVTKPVRPNALREELGKWLTTTQKPSTPPDQASALRPLIGLDIEAIEELWGDDMDTYKNIARIFVKELEELLPALTHSGDGLLEHHAHSLKGAAANIGATQLSSLAAELEVSAPGATSDKVDMLTSGIKKEADYVCKILFESYLNA